MFIAIKTPLINATITYACIIGALGPTSTNSPILIIRNFAKDLSGKRNSKNNAGTKTRYKISNNTEFLSP